MYMYIIIDVHTYKNIHVCTVCNMYCINTCRCTCMYKLNNYNIIIIPIVNDDVIMSHS